MAVYLDSSAIVKLVVLEAESKSLRKFLRRHPSRVSSALARVEVLRAVRPQGQAAIGHARAVLGRIALIGIDDEVIDRAAMLDGSVLRSLDAIHVATALGLQGDLEVLLTYDDRMRKAAAAIGVPTETP